MCARHNNCIYRCTLVDFKISWNEDKNISCYTTDLHLFIVSSCPLIPWSTWPFMQFNSKEICKTDNNKHTVRFVSSVQEPIRRVPLAVFPCVPLKMFEFPYVPLKSLVHTRRHHKFVYMRASTIMDLKLS